MHDCPFCLQNEDSQEEADDAALQEMEIEAAMEAEAVAEGVKEKDQRTTQPSAAHPKVPKPRKPSLHTGWK